MNQAIITAALTGPVATTVDNPAVPVTPEAIAADAHAVYEAGAAVAHVHVRDRDERPSADVELARRTLDLIAQRCPILVQLSTGVGLGARHEDRLGLIEARPQMASLNVCSMTFGDHHFLNPPDLVRRMALRMAELGIRPELEIYDSGHLEVALALRGDGLLSDPLQFSIVLGVRGGMAATPQNLMTMVSRLPADAIWQVVALGRDHLPLSTMALAMGGNVRTGLEDTLLLRRGVPAANRQLVERARALAEVVERPPATVEQAAARLGLATAGAVR
jgi:uncharacterized protein (DUF849 family)